MTAKEAKQIALKYTLEMGEVLPGFRFGLANQEEFSGKYYFDFIWLTLTGEIPDEPPLAGGARGFTIDKKNGEIELMTHVGYTILKDRENKLAEMYQTLMSFKKERKHLTAIKAKFNLNSEQLLTLSRLVKNTDITPENVSDIMATLNLKYEFRKLI